jgi:adenine deaminase
MMPPVPLLSLLRAARGQDPADVVFVNADLFNPFTGDWSLTDFAVLNGMVVGTGTYRGKLVIDLKGAPVIPGMIDAHTHVESSLLNPYEYARLVIQHGTTTVIADPHEIANVCGVRGIEFMLSLRDRLPIDLFLMLPSCVPATPADMGGAILGAGDLEPFTGRPGVLGLGEMMNVPGVLAGDPGVMQKLRMCHLIDGHAPLLRGNDLNAYIVAGIQSDHECTSCEEAREKLEKGMYIFIREGSTERNLEALIPLVSPSTVSRCSFATDDRHADLLVTSGHIDDCVRRAIGYGVEPELAFRMATLSAAGRFGLHDRGAIAPGRIADFCILAERSGCRVMKVFRRGMLVKPEKRVFIPPFRCSFACNTPRTEQIAIAGGGDARVIGLITGQIVTRALEYTVDPGQVPDLSRDLLKVVVISRYQPESIGIGLVHGFGFSSGAIAGSVSHDSHNIIAAGVADKDIIAALDAVIRSEGALAAVSDREKTVLPLGCAGLMSVRPYEEVAGDLGRLQDHAAAMDAIPDPFMYLSFLALTVIPHLRITDRGLFDVDAFQHIPLFSRDPSGNTC